MSRILLTGCAGFVASHILDLLLADGHDVVGLDDLSTGRRENFMHHIGNPHFRFVEGDIRRDADNIFFEWRPEIICHQAAQASLLRSHNEPVFDADVNILGTVRLMKLAEEYECKKFVFASTSAVFSGAAGGYHEFSEPNPDRPYGIAKRSAEMYLLATKTPTTIIRYGNVYGPRQVPVGENQLIARFLNHLYEGGEFKIYGDGSHRRDFVYVDDIARANFVAMFSDITGIVHAGTGNPRSVTEVVRIVSEESRHCGIALPHFSDIQHAPEKEGEPALSYLTTTRADWSVLWLPMTPLSKGIQRTVEWWAGVELRL